MPLVTILPGSLKRPSHTVALCQNIAEILSGVGIRTVVWDFTHEPIAFADPLFHHEPAKQSDANARKLVDLADTSDAFVLGSPIYHNSYSGVLKNALDCLTISQFAGKPVALVGHGGNRSTQAVDHLRIVARGLQAFAITTQTCTADEDYDFVGGEYVFSNRSLIERNQRLCLELITFIKMLRQ